MLYYCVVVDCLSTDSSYDCCVAGVEHVGGDMFDSVPSADAILMKVIVICNFFLHKYCT